MELSFTLNCDSFLALIQDIWLFRIGLLKNFKNKKIIFKKSACSFPLTEFTLQENKMHKTQTTNVVWLVT